MTETSHAVFLSYASEDREAAQRICAALRAADIEVWFDQSELRGGDAWDQKIRRQIRDCALFIPLISAGTASRHEGYFRLEWDLADQRSHMMARNHVFILPVCLDATTNPGADVPESFQRAHWTSLPAGATPPAFVERVRGLLSAGAAAALPPPVVAASHVHRSGRPRLLFGVALAAASVALLGVLLWLTLARDRAPGDPLVNATLTRLTDWSGQEQAATISRDGTMAAFLADHEGRTDAWVTRIGSGSYRNLTQGKVLDLVNPLIRTLGFNPDGSLITVWARQTSAERASEVTVLTIPSGGGVLQRWPYAAAEVAWSSSGQRVAFHTTAPGDPIFVVDSPSQAPRRVYSAPAGVHCHFPVWSPDDAFIYFARGVPPDAAWDIWRIRPSGAGLEQITFHNSLVSHPVLLSRRTLLYLASNADGSGPWLYSTDVETRIPRRISFGLERYTSLAGTVDGRRLVATVASPRTSLWSIALGDGQTTDGHTGASHGADGHASEAHALHRLEAGSGFSPRFGPNYLLYASSRGGGQSLWKLANGASQELWSRERVTLVGTPAISPDGSRIAFGVTDGARTLLYVIQSDGSRARVVSDSLALRGSPAWTPDGQAIVSAVLENGRPHLVTIPLEGGAPLELLSEYSLDPVWSPDGRFFLYSGADVGTTIPVRAASADGGPYALPTLMLTRGEGRAAFQRDGRGVIVLRGEAGHESLWLLELAGGTERQLAELPADFAIRDFDVSPDGTELVFDRVEEDSRIALIERPGEG